MPGVVRRAGVASVKPATSEALGRAAGRLLLQALALVAAVVGLLGLGLGVGLFWRAVRLVNGW